MVFVECFTESINTGPERGREKHVSFTGPDNLRPAAKRLKIHIIT
jgi:hypothetical protein